LSYQFFCQLLLGVCRVFDFSFYFYFIKPRKLEGHLDLFEMWRQPVIFVLLGSGPELRRTICLLTGFRVGNFYLQGRDSMSRAPAPAREK
jgi:hypothetical protein